MKYNFYKQEFLCFDYRRGTIMAKTRKVDESDWEHILEEHRQKFIEETKNKYLLDLYYQPGRSDPDFLVGFYIDSGDDKTVQGEIKRLIESGYMDDCINCSEETAEDFEEFICEKMEKMDLEGGNRKGIGCPNCGE
jgi:hypothetical protein